MARFSLLLFLLLGTLASSAPTEPRDTQSCSQTSFKNLSWVAKGFHYRSSVVFSTPSHQIDGAEVSFNLTNTALPYIMSCHAYSTDLSDFFYGNRWYECSSPDGQAPAGTEAGFQYDKSSGHIDIRQTWSCRDDATFFNATGSANFTLGCNETTTSNPNWTPGAFYSTDIVECAPQDIPVLPSSIQAVA